MSALAPHERARDASLPMPNARALPLDRLGVLDGMRGLAILLVIWYHLWLVTGFGLPYFGAVETLARGGFLGVDLFFFISGFCICYPYAKARFEGRPRPALTEFIRRRAFKIVPSYLLAVAVFAVVYRGTFDDAGQELRHVLLHVAFVHVWSYDAFGSLSGPLWTLGVEVQFYALFALLATQIERRPYAVVAAFVAVAIAYRSGIALAGLDGDFTFVNQLPAVLDVFGAGIAASLAFVALSRAAAPPAPAAATLVALGALALAVLAFAAADAVARGGPSDVHRWLNAWRVAFGPVLFVATLGLALGAAPLRRVAALPALAWLSLVSYNAYLWNLEIVVGVARFGLPAWLTFVLGAAATLAVAAAVTYAFERPLQEKGVAVAAALRRRFTPGTPGPGSDARAAS